MRTDPVNQSAFPFTEGCEPLRTTSTVFSPPGVSFFSSGHAAVTPRNAAERTAAQSIQCGPHDQFHLAPFLFVARRVTRAKTESIGPQRGVLLTHLPARHGTARR